MNYTITNPAGEEYEIISCVLEIPNKGIWIVNNLKIDTETGFKDGDSVVIKFMDKTLLGTFTDFVSYAGYILGTVVGGKATFFNELESITFQNTTVKTIVSYIASKTNHTLSDQSDPSVLSMYIPRFEKLKDMASGSMDRLTSLIGAIWRIGLDGSLIVTKENYPDISIKYPQLIEFNTFDVLDKKPNSGFWRIYCEDFLVEPGFSIENNTVKEIIYDLNIGSEMDINIKWTFFEPDHIQLYNLTQQNSDLIFLYKYRMKVIYQNLNGTVTVIPDPDLDILKNGLREVPIVYTSPNMQVKVSPGAICYVEFANGDPGRPFISGWENTDSLIELDVSNPSSTQLSARKGDGCGYLVFTPNVGMAPAVLTYSPIPVPVTPPVVLIGPIQIQEGSSKVKIGG